MIEQGTITAGRVIKILSPEICNLSNATSGPLLVLEDYQVSDTNDSRLNMPILLPADPQKQYSTKSPAVCLI